MLEIIPVTLSGERIQLEPLNHHHKSDLYNAAQDSRIWMYNGSKAYGDNFYKWFDKAMENQRGGLQCPFVVRCKADQRILGSTRFYDINREHYRLTIGYTWYVPEVWGTFVNPECKRLLLEHAFENLKVNRVEFVTDARNSRSRAAIKKLGAHEEGILRRHMILEDGYVRDTVVFSIIQAEWLAVKTKLSERLKNFNHA
jgi:RimJ/RimL family protein N-acetyltransferase